MWIFSKLVFGKKSSKPFNPQLIYLNFQPLEVLPRYRDPLHQVVENYSYLLNLRTKITNLDAYNVIAFPTTVV